MKNHTSLRWLCSLGLLFLGAGTAIANVRLPALFGNGMVLQRDKAVAVWGWADPGELVAIRLSSTNGQPFVDGSKTTDATGRWQVMLPAKPAGGPYSLLITGKNRLQLDEVYFGDVWICSGQSNMEWKMKWLGSHYDTEVANSTNPNIRLIEIKDTRSFSPQSDVATLGWKSATPTTVPDFSAVAYFFARALQQRIQVPIGLISTEWGGTIAEAWMSREGLSAFPYFQRQADSLARIDAQFNKTPLETRQAAYQQAVLTADKGFSTKGAFWNNPALATADWKKMKLPGVWENAGLPNLDGIVWFRKAIEVPTETAGKDLRLTLGKIDDADSSYFNGQLIGHTEGYSTLRQYTVPGRLVKAGRNVIAIRVLDTGGGGGIWGETKDMVMELNGTGVSLSGDWEYKVSATQKDLPINPATRSNNPNIPTVLNNAMIAPLVPYGIKGAIWYQGESNAGRAYEYQTLFPALIADWRRQFGQGDFPFLFVQLANFQAVQPNPGESDWAELREAQTMTLKSPNTAQAVIIDLGEADNIHPKNKREVGERLALAAQHVAYGDERVIYSGPVYHSMVKDGDKIRLGFDHIAGGLKAKNSPDGMLKGFAIAGADKKWVWATAKIDQNTVVVWSDTVKNPVAVRYGWANNPEGVNLYNAADLPASPFRTDSWKGLTQK